MDDVLHCGTVEQSETQIILSQEDYSQDMNDYIMEPDRAAPKNEPLNPVEMSKHRQLIGSLNWLIRGFRPELAFTMTEASTRFKKATVGYLFKVARKVKSQVIILHQQR